MVPVPEPMLLAPVPVELTPVGLGPLGPVPSRLVFVTGAGLAAEAVRVGVNDEVLDAEPSVEPLDAVGGGVEVGPLKWIGFLPLTICGVST